MSRTVDPEAVCEKLRKDFPVLQRTIDGNPITYLDSAATSLKPAAVISAMTRYYTENSSNIHRGKHYLSEESSNEYERARSKVAQFIGVMSSEVVFVRNTTEALNVVASGLKLERSDRVLVSLDGHHSLLLPWQRVAQVDVARIDKTGTVDLNHFEELLKKRPRVVAITHCSNVSGIFAPLEAMARMAKKAGAIVVVDAAQSAPHRRINASQLDVDFLAFSAHKMCGPTGIGVLFGRAELLEKLEPAYIGGGMVDWVETGSYRLRKVPHRFEAGTPHIAGAYGLAAAIDYLSQVGDEVLAQHDAQLVGQMLDEVARRDYLEAVAPQARENRTAIVSVRIAGCDNLGDIARALSDAYGVMCRSGHLCAQPFVDQFSSGEVLRASAYLYSTKSDVARLFRALDEIKASMAVSGGRHAAL